MLLYGAGAPLGLALHLAGLAGAFLDGAGPPLGRALHLARLAFMRRAAQLALRRTLSSTCAASESSMRCWAAARPPPAISAAPAIVPNKLFLI
jgi:hypothetical protein